MKIKLGSGQSQVLPRRQVHIREGIDGERLTVSVGVGFQDLSPDECREFADALKDAAAQMEEKSP